ncbi:unnamed protein product [Rotaria socialis]|uniref:Ig-like domain-containing protein n=1 Tax=Rotaria socialis TaxID=392032 RepID=A0A819YSA6_9BILA|nr:unnamed protein product [Rotaria socialis]CAF4163227.1 unnamed protein product [Rotaria socialis]
MAISPHGGYVSIDEGADFYIECIGPSPKWIIAKRLISDTARISTQSVQMNRKSILTIQGMSSSLVGPYLCQTNQSVSTIILQITKRKLDMTKQIRFMGTNTNHTVSYGNDTRLNCFAQYYSEKAMDSPYIPKILWFFERRQLHHNEHKYIFGVDSLFIRNFTYHDQGVYFCRAFITLKTRFLMKIYPILVQLQNSSWFVNETLPPSLENKNCDNLNETVVTNNTISYCNTGGYVSNCTCPQGQIWNEDYSQCSSPMNQNQILQIIPNVSHMNVELGRTYTFVCRSTDDRIEPEWTYENGTTIDSSTHTEQSITTYILSEGRTLYLRLSPAVSGTYICRSRPEENSILKEESSITTTTSITLREQMIVQTNGISFQSSALAEYHVRTNSTLFVACRPEYFNFQLKTNLSYVPAATLIRIHDNNHFLLTELIDGLLIDRISKSESGMYLCMGMIPLPEQLITSFYPIMYGDGHNNLYSSRWSVTELKDRQTNISVFARIYEEYTDAEHFFDFAKKTAAILFQTKAASLIFAASLVLPIIMISVGISNLEECPLDRNIPVFVLVGGALALLKLLQVLWKQYNRHSAPSEEETTDTQNGSTFMEGLTTIFLIIWFIYGNYLILHYRLPRFEQTTEDPENWCSKNVYFLTIISVAYTYASVTIMILVVFIVVLTVHLQNRRRAIQEAKEAGCT